MIRLPATRLLSVDAAAAPLGRLGDEEVSGGRSMTRSSALPRSNIGSRWRRAIVVVSTPHATSAVTVEVLPGPP